MMSIHSLVGSSLRPVLAAAGVALVLTGTCEAQSDEATNVTLWFRGGSAVEFADLNRHADVTLSAWITDQSASRELPDQKGHYIFYRHESPDGDSVEYWFGPFERGRELDRSFFRMQELTGRLRQFDRQLYATARVVRVHSPEDDFVRRLSEEDREALSLAWVLEQIEALERIELLERRLDRLVRRVERGELPRDAVEVQAAIDAIERQAIELHLRRQAAGDNVIAAELFPLESALPPDVGRTLRENLALAAVAASERRIDAQMARRSGMPADFMDSLVNVLDAALRDLGIDKEYREDALANVRDYAQSGQGMSRAELLSALYEPGQLLLESLGAAADVPMRRLATDSLSAQDVRRMHDALSSDDALSYMQPLLNQAANSDLIDTTAVSLDDIATQSKPSELGQRTLSSLIAYHSGTQHSADPFDRGHQQIQMTLGATAEESNQWRDQGLSASESEQLLDAIVEAYGFAHADMLMRSLQIDPGETRNSGMDSQTFQQIAKEIGSDSAELSAAAMVATNARESGVDVAAAVRQGLNSTAAKQFQQAVEQTIRDILEGSVETAESGHAADNASRRERRAAAAAAQNAERLLAELASATGVAQGSTARDTARTAASSSPRALADAIAARVASHESNRTASRDARTGRRGRSSSGAGMSSAEVNALLARVSRLQAAAQSRPGSQGARQAGTRPGTREQSGTGSGPPIQWYRIR